MKNNRNYLMFGRKEQDISIQRLQKMMQRM
jgi:hypothetical protein